MSDLTISQALRRIKKIKGQLSEYRSRAQSSVTHLADQTPAFSFEVETSVAAKAVNEMLRLQTAVAVANATTTVEVDGHKVPLAFVVRQLRELTGEIAWLKTLPVKAQDKVVESEIDYTGERPVTVPKTYTCHLPEAKRAALVESRQALFDRLNDLVETTNHKTPVRLAE